jgi:hypothetical protein
VKVGRDRIEKNPDQRVQDALKLVFTKFAEFQSARQVHIWLRDEGIELPVKSPNGEARGMALVQTFGINETNARDHCAAQAARTAFQTAGALLSLIRSLESVNSQPSPHFSHEGERLLQRSVLIQIFAKSRNEWPQTGLRHIWDQLMEYAALPEQRMGSVFGGVDLEMAVHAEAFAGGAEQRQKHDGEGVQKKQPVAPLQIGDAKN